MPIRTLSTRQLALYLEELTLGGPKDPHTLGNLQTALEAWARVYPQLQEPVLAFARAMVNYRCDVSSWLPLVRAMNNLRQALARLNDIHLPAA